MLREEAYALTTEEIGKRLVNSHWPECNVLCEVLVERAGNEAKLALIGALSSKTHHVRTAAINALTQFRDPALTEVIQPLVSDRAYETRMAAQDAIRVLKEVVPNG